MSCLTGVSILNHFIFLWKTVTWIGQLHHQWQFQSLFQCQHLQAHQEHRPPGRQQLLQLLHQCELHPLSLCLLFSWTSFGFNCKSSILFFLISRNCIAAPGVSSSSTSSQKGTNHRSPFTSVSLGSEVDGLHGISLATSGTTPTLSTNVFVIQACISAMRLCNLAICL